MQKHLFEEECARAGSPRIVPFGPVMVAPVIMAFGSPEQQKRFLPGIASGEVWWSQGYSEPGAGSDLASLKTRAERRGDKYIVNGQKTWTTLGQFGEWIFCLVRTSTEGKPQTGISFLLIDMKSPGVTVRPIVMLDGEPEVNEVFFDNVEVPAENLIGEENKGWTYAKHLLAHERTNIADVNRAKREIERLKRIARAEGVYDDARFRDQIALLEVDIVALEMLVLRVLSAEKSGKQSLDIAGLLKIKGSEIQQRYSELMMLAARPVHDALCARGDGGRLAGRLVRPLRRLRTAGRQLLQPPQDHDLRRQQRSAAKHRRADGARLRPRAVCARRSATSLPSPAPPLRAGRGSSQRNKRSWHGLRIHRRPTVAARRGGPLGRQGLRLRAPPRHRQAGGHTRDVYGELAGLGLTGLAVHESHGGMGFGAIEAMVVMEELGRGLVNAPYAAGAAGRAEPARAAPAALQSTWLPTRAAGRGAGRAGAPGARGALPRRTQVTTAAKRAGAAGN